MVVDGVDDFERDNRAPLAAGEPQELAGLQRGHQIRQGIDRLPVHRLANKPAEVAGKILPAAAGGVGVEGADITGAGQVPQHFAAEGCEHGGFLSGEQEGHVSGW